MEKTQKSLNEVKKKLEDLISWSNDLPEETIKGDSDYSKYKFRTPWFKGIADLVSEIVANSDDNLLIEANNLRDQILEKRNKEEKTTKDDIDRGDQLIKRALEKLKSIS